MPRRIAFILLAALLAVGALCAQSNERMDELLAQPVARLDSAAYMILSAAGAIPEEASPDEAFAALQEKAWLKGERAPEDGLSVGELCFVLMKALNLKGGLFYSIFPGPRYAYRDMVYREVVSSQTPSGKRASGEDVVRALRNALELKGGAE